MKHFSGEISALVANVFPQFPIPLILASGDVSMLFIDFGDFMLLSETNLRLPSGLPPAQLDSSLSLCITFLLANR